MLIIIKKKENSNQWDYPGNVRDFITVGRHPERDDKLIVKSKLNKTLEDLNHNSSYQIIEFDGVVERRKKDRRLNADRRKS
jgi:hypothetical protein